MITELRLRGLEVLLIKLCPLCGTRLNLFCDTDKTATVLCEYEGYAKILRDLFKKQKNIAKLQDLGYHEITIKLGDRPKPIAIVKVFDPVL